MAFGWGPSLERAARPRELPRISRLLRDLSAHPAGYVLFMDMTTRAADESAPLQQKQWRIWKGLIAGRHLYETTPTRGRFA